MSAKLHGIKNGKKVIIKGSINFEADTFTTAGGKVISLTENRKYISIQDWRGGWTRLG